MAQVNFAPGEPNGGTGESAVTLDMRGPQGIITSSGQARHGMWNDDQVNTTACTSFLAGLRRSHRRRWAASHREIAWNYGAAAAAWSFDTFFGEHILTQGTAYT